MAKFTIYKANNYEFRWRLRANNGKIIADSGEGYTNKNDCIYGINFVKQYAPSAIIEDSTLLRVPI